MRKRKFTHTYPLALTLRGTDNKGLSTPVRRMRTPRASRDTLRNIIIWFHKFCIMHDYFHHKTYNRSYNKPHCVFLFNVLLQCIWSHYTFLFIRKYTLYDLTFTNVNFNYHCNKTLKFNIFRAIYQEFRCNYSFKNDLAKEFPSWGSSLWRPNCHHSASCKRE